MAGRQHSRRDRDITTIQRSSQYFEDGWARARDPRERLWAAVSYLQAAISRAVPAKLGSTAAEEISEKAIVAARELDRATTVALRERAKRDGYE
jgi:hypothetical protein